MRLRGFNVLLRRVQFLSMLPLIYGTDLLFEK